MSFNIFSNISRLPRYAATVHIAIPSSDYDVELQRSPDNVTFATVCIIKGVTMANFEADYSDTVPMQVTPYYYRARLTRDGYQAGDWSSSVAAYARRVTTDSFGKQYRPFIDLSDPFLAGKNLDNLQRSSGDTTLASQVVSRIANTGHLSSSIQDGTNRTVTGMFHKTLDDLDDVDDSIASYKRVLSSAVNAGQVDFSKSGVINRASQFMVRSTIDGTNLGTIIQYMGNNGHLGASMADYTLRTVTGMFHKTSDDLDDVDDSIATFKRTTANEKTGGGRGYSAIDAGNILVTTGLDFSRGYTNKDASNLPRMAGGTAISSVVARIADTGHLSGSINDGLGRTVTGLFHKTSDDLDDVDDSIATYKKTTANEKTGGGRGYTAIDAGNVIVTSGLDFSRAYTNKDATNLPRNAGGTSISTVVARIADTGHLSGSINDGIGRTVTGLFHKSSDDLDDIDDSIATYKKTTANERVQITQGGQNLATGFLATSTYYAFNNGSGLVPLSALGLTIGDKISFGGLIVLGNATDTQSAYFYFQCCNSSGGVITEFDAATPLTNTVAEQYAVSENNVIPSGTTQVVFGVFTSRPGGASARRMMLNRGPKALAFNDVPLRLNRDSALDVHRTDTNTTSVGAVMQRLQDSGHLSGSINDGTGRTVTGMFHKTSDDLDDVDDTIATYKKTTANEKDGGNRAFNGLTSTFKYSGSEAYDGVRYKRITKGGQEADARHNGSVTFNPVFQATPMIRLSGGVLYEPGAVWGTSGSIDTVGSGSLSFLTGSRVYDDFAPVNPSSTGFTVRARLWQRGTVQSRNIDFDGTTATSVGSVSTSNVLTNAPSANDAYTVRWSIDVTATSIAGKTRDATYTVALESDPTGTGAWVERGTYSYAVSDSSGTGTTVSYAGESDTKTVSGFNGSGKWRVKVKSVTASGSGTNSVALHGLVNGTDGLYGVSFTTSAGDQFANKTPLTSDIIHWQALET